MRVFCSAGERAFRTPRCERCPIGETQTLRTAGVTVLAEPYDHVGGHRRSYVADPDGNRVALVDAPR
jgi:Glyoxalase/Bleomycin resistance protein/Dioxygenase superfamily